MNVPKLRFKEFTDEWQKKTLNDIISNSSKKYNPLTSNINYPCIELESISSNSGTILNTFDSLKQKSIKNIFKKDDILFGKLRPYLRKYWYANFDGVCSSEIWVFNNKLGLNKYLYYLIQTNKFILIANNSTGSKMPRADWKFIKSQNFYVANIQEQNKIANFLSTVDKKISNLENIITTLENQKKGLLQQIFNQKLRFKDENGNNYPDWKHKQLGDICKFTGGGTPSTSILKYWNGTIPWISSSDLQTNTIHKINISRYITNEAVSNSSTKIIPKNSILIVSRVGVGKVAISNCVLCTSQDFTNITEINGNTIFYAYLLKYKMEQLTQNTQGTSIKGITTSDIKNIKLIVPTEQSEQTKIADFLSAFDRKIDNQKAQLEHWKQVKKGLLQQMFV